MIPARIIVGMVLVRFDPRITYSCLPIYAVFRDRYRILHFTWFAFFLCFILWFNTAPLSIAIRKDLALNVVQIRRVIVCNSALTIPARILIGMSIDRCLLFILCLISGILYVINFPRAIHDR